MKNKTTKEEMEKILEELNRQIEELSGISSIIRISEYYDASSGKTIRGDTDIKKYLLEKYFKEDMLNIIGE